MPKRLSLLSLLFVKHLKNSSITILNKFFNFAEKFFKAKIANIIYGKVDFVVDESNIGKTVPANPVIYDLTPLYYLNGVTNAMEYKSAEDAVKALDTILDI